MAFIDVWQASIPASLAEFAELMTDPQDVTLALAAAAVLWPIRESIHTHDGDAYDTLRSIVPDQAGLLLKSVASWEGDRLGLAQQLAQKAAENPDLREALTQFVTFFKATPLLTERLLLRLVPQSGGATYNISGAIQAPLANFGGITTIGQLTLVSRSEAEELDTFLSDAVNAYQLDLLGVRRDIPDEPYKFLYPFELRDRAIFFGRDTAVQALLDRIFKARLTVVHARSGAGKTSLLRAGVGPRLLDDGYLPVFARTYKDPVADIVKQIASHGPSLRPRLLANLSLREFLRYVVDHMGRRTRELVIVLDQFEELFTLTSPARRAQTLDALVECIEDDSLPLRLVLAIRKDYFSDLAAFEPRLPSVFANRFHLEPMTEQEIRQAITEPLRKVAPSVTYGADLLQKLVGVLITGALDLPELQILCTRLHDQTEAEGAEHITLAMYEADGEAQGILSQYFDDAMARFSARELPTARKTLVALVGSTGQRLIAAPAEIAQQTSEDVAQVEKILDKLVGARLLRRNDDGRYELSHDYVIPSVQAWIRPEQLEIKRIREALQRSVDDWRTDRLLIPPEWLLAFHERREVLAELDDDARVCLLLSSAWHEVGVDDWSDQADETIVQRIVKLLAEDRPEVHRYAARVLGRLGRLETTIPALDAILEQSGDPETKLEAALALRRLGDSGVNTLLDVLNTATDWLTSHAAIETFYRDPVLRAVAILIRMLDAEIDSKRIMFLARVLEVHNDLQAIPSLIRAMFRLSNRQAQQELVRVVKVLQNNARTEEEEQSRRLIAIYKGNVVKLEAQISACSEIYAPVHLITELQHSREELLRLRSRLDSILGPGRMLEEPRTQIRIMSVLGFEAAQQIISGLDLPRALEALIIVLTNRSDSDVWLDCATVLFGFYEQAWQYWEPHRQVQRHYRYQEYLRTKAGLEVNLSILNNIVEAETELRRQENAFQPYRENLSVFEPRLAEALVDILQQGIQPNIHRTLVAVLARMVKGGIAPLIAALQSSDESARDEFVTALEGIVERNVLVLDELRYLRYHLQHLHDLYLQRLTYLQEKQQIFGDKLPDNFKIELTESPRLLAEVDSRIPLIEYEISTMEKQLVLPLANLLQAGVPKSGQRTVVVAVARFGLVAPVVMLEALRRIEPLATDTLITQWRQNESDRERIVRALEVMVAQRAIQLPRTHPFVDYRDLQSEQNRQEIAHVLMQLWSTPDALRWIEGEVRTVLHALVTAADNQACADAAQALEILWERRMQPIRLLRMTNPITSAMLSMLYHEFELPGELEVRTIDNLLDRIETHVAEVLIATLQRTNDANLQCSIAAILARLGPAVVDVLTKAFQGTTEPHQSQALSDGTKRCIKTLVGLQSILRTRRENFDEFNKRYTYVLEYRDRQIALTGKPHAPVEWLLDRDIVIGLTTCFGFVHWYAVYRRCDFEKPLTSGVNCPCTVVKQGHFDVACAPCWHNQDRSGHAAGGYMGVFQTMRATEEVFPHDSLRRYQGFSASVSGFSIWRWQE